MVGRSVASTFTHREVARRVVPEHLRPSRRRAVGEQRLDLVGALDDVVVGDDHAVGRDDEPGARRTAGVGAAVVDQRDDRGHVGLQDLRRCHRCARSRSDGRTTTGVADGELDDASRRRRPRRTPPDATSAPTRPPISPRRATGAPAAGAGAPRSGCGRAGGSSAAGRRLRRRTGARGRRRRERSTIRALPGRRRTARRARRRSPPRTGGRTGVLGHGTVLRVRAPDGTRPTISVRLREPDPVRTVEDRTTASPLRALGCTWTT